MKISLKLLDSSNEISKQILEALLIDVNKYMNKSIKVVQEELPKIIYSAIISSPEYSSIIGGKLRFDFGIPDGATKIESLLKIWTSNIDINYNPAKIKNNQIISSFSISMIKADYSDVLGTDYASVIDNIRGYSLPWLEWLLTKGGSIIVRSFEVQYGPNPRSRSGDAIMISSSSNWRVPSEFSGTPKNNWITRALSTIETKIIKVLEDELRAML